MEDKKITNGLVRLDEFTAPFQGRYLASAAQSLSVYEKPRRDGKFKSGKP